MIDWYVFALMSLVCQGIYNFLYKVSAEKKCNTAWTTLSFMVTVAIISTILFFVLHEQIINVSFLLIIALLNAVTFLATTILRMEALKNIPTNVVYPLLQMSTVLVVVFSVVYFGDKLSFYQIIGILLAVITLFIVTRQDNAAKSEHKNFKLGVVLTVIALFASAATVVLQKFAVANVGKLSYMMISYYYNVLFSFCFLGRMQTSKENTNHRNAVLIGIAIGVFNFFAFYLALGAYTTGMMSVAASIMSMFFVLTVVLSIIFYKEKLTLRRLVGILLAIVAVVLLRL